ncbi:hypothetical protein EK21DRAFT_103018 [Setomelanomma holmii]|uniref:Rhodopsin domain-containing protein n=1 Tax=Setomelanomma holmii TaxID=210430 RepID=A0A9P4H2J5_9PLEO|nr:hypothetical protein EK21DRAFT_103018 [Setomelanomma holmii]
MSTYQEIISEKRFVQIAYAMVILASVFCLARLTIQIWKRKKMEMPDYLIYFAFICFLTMSICYFMIVPKIYKIGRVSLGLIEPWPTMLEDIIHYIRMMFVTTTLFWIALWSVKLSLLALYKKLMEGLPRVYMRLWWALFIFCLVSLAGCVVSYLTSCPDFAASLSKGECSGPRSVRGQLASLYTSYSVDILSDFMIMAFPIKLVWNLQMARGQKIGIIALFGSGFVCIAFATIRVIQIGMKTGGNTSPSPTWLALWTIIESAIAICIGCCPAFAVLYRTTRATQASYNSSGTNDTMSSPTSSSPSTRAPSIAPSYKRSHSSPNHTHSLGTFSLKSAIKKPFQGWSKELLRARDDDDDDYNFASGLRRGCEPGNYRNDC